ncbi:hypothetical protein PPERSA_09934 [Pseudocohnilembus persalinus]|uniref:Tubulin-tyrosine ligase/Tubulin polyglutamylase n=1 Tax=Pseudocohnilembus persalinus TaxID=266149 RepID=A0A0V0QJ91_PSEPJ|nr:hypothetical protein PPERSA_09934 [Pseudocohnilembus persalinus]|eukprot:KRX02317.1 hypothetical protein PPERSA_09934 [Pseudocohnilembus persalinus]
MELGITGVKVQQNVRSDKKPQLQIGQSSIRIKTQTVKSKIVKTNSDRQIQQKQNVKIIKKLEEGFKLPPIPRVNKFTKNVSTAKNSTQIVQSNSILQSKQLQKRNSVQKKQIQEQDQQAELTLQQENQKIHLFFRFKLATLMHVLDFPQYYEGNTTKKVFIISGGYQSLRKQLIELGWYENPDKDSLYFDLKWTLRTKDIDFGLALDCQFINHVSNVGRYPTIQKDEWKLLKQWPNLKQNLKQEKIQKIRNKLQDEFETGAGQQDIQGVITQCLNQQKDYNPQYNMQGENNLWVIKPAGLSRGRGIRSFQDLEPIFEYVFSKDIQWVAQKYMENLYLIDGKKFDLRQWVLVTDFNPLTIFYYDECYARICSEKYDVNDLNNKYAQIVNQCIQKKKQNFDEEKEDTTMTQDEFKSHLIKNEGSDKFQSIKKKMIKAIISSLKSVSDSVQYRKNSFEFLGYDFMIDDQLNPWLIEINTSPSMEYTTSVTKRLVQMGLTDTAKLINNYLFNNRNIQKNTDIGNWKFCYREQKDQK